MARHVGGIATICHRVTRSALIAIIGSAAMTAGASAQVEVSYEGGEHCTPVVLISHDVSGGCHLDATSDGNIDLEAFGALVTGCSMTFDLALDEDGHGYAFNQDLTGPDCFFPPCGSTQPTPWEVEVFEGSGTTAMTLRLCISSSALGTVNCHLRDIQVDTADHQATRFALDAAPCESPDFIHFTGSFSAVGDEIEVAHL
jgi:hypothetical protein